MTDQEFLEIINAHLEGKTIEQRLLTNKNIDNAWVTIPLCLKWNLAEYEYRIKPINIFEPYATIEEFVANMKEHGPYIKYKKGEKYYLPTEVNKEKTVQMGIYNAAETKKSFEYLAKNAVWQDGTPCANVIVKK